MSITFLKTRTDPM